MPGGEMHRKDAEQDADVIDLVEVSDVPETLQGAVARQSVAASSSGDPRLEPEVLEAVGIALGKTLWRR